MTDKEFFAHRRDARLTNALCGAEIPAHAILAHLHGAMFALERPQRMHHLLKMTGEIERLATALLVIVETAKEVETQLDAPQDVAPNVIPFKAPQ